jgi:YVTN family beta-propeller protein
LGMEVSPDGTRVYVTVTDPVTNTKFDGTVSVIDTATSTVITTVPVGGVITGVAVSPDSTRVYVTHYNDNGDDSDAGIVSVIAVADGLFDNSRSSQLIAELIGAVERDGGGWLVIGDHVVPIPPRSPFLSSIAEAAAPHLGQAIENGELADQIRQLLQARSR